MYYGTSNHITVSTFAMVLRAHVMCAWVESDERTFIDSFAHTFTFTLHIHIKASNDTTMFILRIAFPNAHRADKVSTFEWLFKSATSELTWETLVTKLCEHTRTKRGKFYVSWHGQLVTSCTVSVSLNFAFHSLIARMALDFVVSANGLFTFIVFIRYLLLNWMACIGDNIFSPILTFVEEIHFTPFLPWVEK